MSFMKADSALKRAEELISADQQHEALKTLQNVVANKRNRTWTQNMENILMKYVELCVNMKKGKSAKDGLMQFKNISQQMNAASLELVIKHFLELSEKRAQEVEAISKEAIDIEDLDQDATPESVLLEAISGDSKDKSDRESVTPWLKFLWESYRTVLDLLRNNPKLENLYQDTACRAFDFCAKYQRKTEFRRLCEILRQHLSNLQRYSHHPLEQRVSLSSPETFNLHMETRFKQLNVATELELWQEAYRTIEDIHGLISIAKKPVKPSMMINYFEKLTKIFWVSQNHLFHAYAWYKLFNITRSQKKDLAEEQLRSMASAVLLSTIAIPISKRNNGDKLFDFDTERERNTKNAILFGSNVAPKRETLLADVQKNIAHLAFPELKDLYSILEVDFHPLSLMNKMAPIFSFIENNAALKNYVQPLRDIATMRLLEQLSKVYKVMKIDQVVKLAKATSFQSVERIIVAAAQQRILSITIDHQNASLSFGDMGLDSDVMRKQLTTVAKKLQSAVNAIYPERQLEKEKKKRAAFAAMLEGIEEEHERILRRRAIIEERKQYQEREEEEKRRQAEERLRKQQEAKAKAEEERLKKEAEQRERERLKREEESKQLEKAMAVLAQVEQKSTEKARQLKEKIKKDPTAIAKIDQKALLQETVSEKEKKQQEKEKRILNAAKQVDFMERAMREREWAHIEEAYEKQKVEDRKHYEEQVEIARSQYKKRHEADLQEKNRLSRIAKDRDEFVERIMSARRQIYEKLKAEQDARYKEQKAKYDAFYEEKRRAAEERRKEKERIRKEREEAQRKKEEEEAAARKRDEERQAALKKQAELQRQKFLEMEAREAAEREAAAAAAKRDSGTYVPPWRRGGRDVSPPRRDRSPPRRDRSPIRRERSPPRRGMSPPRRDEGAWRRDRSPPRRDRSPVRRDRSPPRRDRSPIRRDRSPIRRDRSPPRRDRSPIRRDRSPPRRAPSPQRREEEDDDGFTTVTKPVKRPGGGTASRK
eukprot:GEZU01029097.1.p1 GENE.GEZU01029097.1~~GEZU01029097.1.p1  ORF type:complete len:1006 (+),score=440.49 GEZU01029097.1:35-3019(+)